MNIFKKADILIPQNISFEKWSVVACDQYTSEPEYWERVEKNVEGVPSAYNIVFPEIYLSCGDSEERIKNINLKMEEYLNSGLFKEYKDSFVMVQRTQRNGKTRTGIVGAIDLDSYSFVKGEGTAVRATEGTVIERIPPRVKIRENAPLELPHILILIDDREKKVVEPLIAEKDNFEKIYDFDCMMDSGHLTGYKVSEEASQRVLSALDEMNNAEYFKDKYSTDSEDVLLFAVGDGNHSLATAKTCWENIKNSLSDEEKENHPARYALVEVMNIHDETLEFEPIHRVVFGVDPKKLIDGLRSEYKDVSDTDNGGQHIKYMYKDICGDLYINGSDSNLAVGTLQNFIDKYLKENNGSVDYIHGDAVVKKLSKEDGNIGFLLPTPQKSELFETIITDGVLPRKTFSMGEAEDKRFYLECKKIK